MNYTIMTTEDIHNGQVLDLVKSGNAYNVDFTNKEIFITKKFRTIDEAQRAYIEIVNYFIHGVYDSKTRARNLTKKEF